jgi:hypothetical protein
MFGFKREHVETFGKILLFLVLLPMLQHYDGGLWKLEEK